MNCLWKKSPSVHIEKRECWVLPSVWMCVMNGVITLLQQPVLRPAGWQPQQCGFFFRLPSQDGRCVPLPQRLAFHPPAGSLPQVSQPHGQAGRGGVLLGSRRGSFDHPPAPTHLRSLKHRLFIALSEQECCWEFVLIIHPSQPLRSSWCCKGRLAVRNGSLFFVCKKNRSKSKQEEGTCWNTAAMSACVRLHMNATLAPAAIIYGCKIGAKA